MDTRLNEMVTVHADWIGYECSGGRQWTPQLESMPHLYL